MSQVFRLRAFCPVKCPDGTAAGEAAPHARLTPRALVAHLESRVTAEERTFTIATTDFGNTLRYSTEFSIEGY